MSVLLFILPLFMFEVVSVVDGFELFVDDFDELADRNGLGVHNRHYTLIVWVGLVFWAIS